MSDASRPILFTPNNHSRYEIVWKPASSDAAEHATTVLQRTYGFDAVHSIEQVDEWERMSNNFRVRGRRHGKDETVHLRKHVQLKEEAAIALINRIVQELRSQDIPVPLLYAAEDGSFQIEDDGCWYQCFAFLEGDHYRGTEHELYDFARGAAKLDSAFRSVSVSDEIRRKPLIIPPWHLNELHEFAEIATGRKNEIDLYVLSVMEEVMTIADRVKRAMSEFSNLPEQPIHYDFHPHNTIFHDGVLKAILDYDAVRMGELSRDVGMACHRFVRQYVVHQGLPWAESLPTGLRIFLRAYESELPLSPQDKAALPVLMLDELVSRICFILRGYYRDGNDRNYNGGNFDKMLTLMREADVIATMLSRGAI